MTQQEPPRPPRPAQPAPPRPEAQLPPQPSLKCPFCGGSRFDFGRDLYAGPDRVMYCRKSPPPGGPPDRDLSLQMKGAVCLDCGYVAVMVDIRELRAPIRRPKDASDVLARRFGLASRVARSGEQEVSEAAEALEKMGADQQADRPPQGTGRLEDGIADIATLIDEAERQLGMGKEDPGREEP